MWTRMVREVLVCRYNLQLWPNKQDAIYRTWSITKEKTATVLNKVRNYTAKPNVFTTTVTWERTSAARPCP